MRALLFLGIIIFASGCIEAGLQPAVAGIAKTLPEAKSFLNEYPEATMKTALYSSVSIKAVLEEFKKDCPELGQEGKSYYRISITDEPSGREMIMWLDTKDNSMVCAVRTTTAVRAETTTTTAPPAITTETTGTAAQPLPETKITSAECSGDATRCSGDLLQSCYNGKWTLGENCAYGCDSSLPSPRCRTSPTTTIILNASATTATTLQNATTTTGILGATTTTTLAGATTTTIGGATTTSAATTSITSSTTTTTTALPDLLVQSIVVYKTSATQIHMDITVKNGGSAASLAQTFGKVFTPAGTTQTNSFTIPAMAAGETKVFIVSITSSYVSQSGPYTSEISLDHGDLYVRESNENNNKQTISYSVPLTADVTWP